LIERPAYPSALAWAPEFAANFVDAIAFDDTGARGGMGFARGTVEFFGIEFQGLKSAELHWW
jgi:hypothetical protein